MFPGIEITINGENFTLPALSLGQLRNGALKLLQEHDALIAAGKFYEAVALRGDVIHTALTRNYPSFAKERLFSWLDLENSAPLWLAVLGASGFKPGEVVAAAEVKPAESGT